MKHLLFLLLVPLLALAASTPPKPTGAYRPPDGMVIFVVPDNRTVLVPEQFAREAGAVIACESSWDTTAVGKAGELGWLMIHVTVHRVHMVELGLDPMQEHDRILFAVELWREQGWQPWYHCAKLSGLLP